MTKVTTGNTDRREFHVTGMDCAEEVEQLRRALLPLDEVTDIGVDLLSDRLVVYLDRARDREPDLIGVVAGTGMTASPFNGGGEIDSSASKQRGGWTAVSAVFLLAALISQSLVAEEWREVFQGVPSPIAGVLYVLSILTGIVFVLPQAAQSLKSLRPDMHLLMTIAVVSAVILDEWFEAATVTILFSLSLNLEASSIRRARRSVASLLDLSPQEATLLEEDAEGQEVKRSVPVSDVPSGARVLVLPGERIPVDGVVSEGASAVDASTITGESLPAEIGVGDKVYAGTMNHVGALEIQASGNGSNTVLAGILSQVQEAQLHRSRSERFVERFARIYTSAVLVAALGILFLAVYVFGETWHDSIYRSLVLLMIACPCALVISTPVSVVCGLAAAARRGILVKSGAILEQPATVDCLALDKTGTLTLGRPQVVSVHALGDHEEDEILSKAACLERGATHPIAKAIVAGANAKNLNPERATSVQTLAGKGVEGCIAGKDHWLGSHRLLEEREQETSEVHKKIVELENEGASIVVVGNDAHACGFIALKDEPRPEAKRAMKSLGTIGVGRVIMLTGDNEGTARSIADRVGIEEVRAELLPAEKVQAVRELVDDHKAVAMVGDGINDAPALAHASLGIAMGGVGTDVAIDTADIVVMSDDLTHLTWLVEHSRRVLSTIRVNVVSSLVVKGVVFYLAVSGFASLWGAILADMGISLAVVANSLRLLRR